MLNVARLRLLREFANRKTIAATADAFFMSPSAVSQQLSTLERETGLELLKKEGRNVILTDAALQLVKDSEEIFSALEKAEAQVSLMSEGVGGTIELSAFPTAACRIIVPMLVRLRETTPNIALHVSDLEPEVALPMLRAEDLDVMVYYDWTLVPSIPSQGLAITELLSERVYLAMPKDHPLAGQNRPIALSELENESWIAGLESTSMGAVVQAATGRAGFDANYRFQTMDFEVILTAVAAGLGLALVPSLGFSEQRHGGVVFKRVADIELRRTIKAAVRKGSEQTPLTRVVLGALRDISDEVHQRLEKIDEEIG
ncbi:MAG: LysR substrate-binding domain-containing protein [Coriobacteriia bacterium]|nr:LysR substrate-binding domain-containing protein [Coriobacteriia bacterium]